MAKKVSGVEITADKIAHALIDRLIRAEKQVAELSKRLDENFSLIAEIQPRITSDGTLKMRVMPDEGEGTEKRVEIYIPRDQVHDIED